jgi:Predicted pPIWI-associating nuclease
MDEEDKLNIDSNLNYLANLNSKVSVISDQVNRFTLPESVTSLNKTITAFSDQMNQAISPISESIQQLTKSFEDIPTLRDIGSINTGISTLLETTRELNVANLIGDDSPWAIKPLDSLKVDFKLPEVELPSLTQFQINLETDEQNIFKLTGAVELPSVKFDSASSLTFNNPLLNIETQNLLNVESNICKNLELTCSSQQILSNYNFDNIAGSLAQVPDLIDPLKTTLDSFSTNYRSALEPLTTDINTYLSVPPTLISGSAIEYFNNTSLYETVMEEIIDVPLDRRVLENEIEAQNQEEVPALLERVNPDLRAMWNGAIAAIDSNNPDKTRHFSISMRELITHVIHTLAPDKDIKNWTNNVDYYHNNRPTRKARLNYICRETATGSFSDFMESDIASIIEMMNLFHAGTHKVDSDLSTRQLIVLKRRVESSIKYLIEISI